MGRFGSLVAAGVVKFLRRCARDTAKKFNAAIAQLVERRPCKADVESSSLFWRHQSLSESGSEVDHLIWDQGYYGACEFESHLSDQYKCSRFTGVGEIGRRTGFRFPRRKA